MRNAAGCLTEGAAASAEWRAGCMADQSQLSHSDALRHSSVFYRQGWNSYQAAATQEPDQPTPMATAAPVPDNAATPGPASPAPLPTAPPTPHPSINTAAIAGVIVAIFLILLGMTLYFLPTLIAASRRKRNALAIFALNLFLGWTMLGWVLALVWSLSVDALPPVGPVR